MNEAYEAYLRYVSLYGNIFSGFIFTDYVMLREEVLKNHERKISYDSVKGLYRTYLENGKMITAKTKEGLEDKIFCFYLDHNIGIYSFPQVLMRALVFNRKNDSLSQSTIDRYTADYRKFLKESVVFNQDIRSITETDLYLFFTDLMKDHPSAKVVSNIKTVIRLAFNYARIYEHIECLYVNTVFSNMQFSKRSFKPVPVPVDRVFPLDLREKLFSVMDDCNILDQGIKLDFYTGLRVGELCALKSENVSIEERILLVNTSESVSGYGKDRKYEDADPKGYKHRNVVLSDTALDILDHISLSREYLFPFKDKHYHAASFDTRIRNLCKKCGLPSYSMHDIRRTYASMLLDTPGITEQFVKDQLGHADIRTTQQYYHYCTSRKNDYINMANLLK